MSSNERELLEGSLHPVLSRMGVVADLTDVFTFVDFLRENMSFGVWPATTIPHYYCKTGGLFEHSMRTMFIALNVAEATISKDLINVKDYIVALQTLLITFVR